MTNSKRLTRKKLPYFNAIRQLSILLFLTLIQICADRIYANPNQRQIKPNKSFLFFDQMGYSEKPDLTASGLKPITLIDIHSLWKKNESKDTPNENIVRLMARRASQFGELACIDIEHWPLRDIEHNKIQKNIQKLQRIADLMHETSPELRLGYYSLLPIRDFWIPVKDEPKNLSKWHEDNKRLVPLSRHVDVIFPSLYTFNQDHDAWIKYATANLNQATIYNKQIYVFLWPQYTSSNPELHGKFIPPDIWRSQLELCFHLADGVVIWSPIRTKDNTQTIIPKWNTDWPWWIETQEFIRKKRNLKASSWKTNDAQK